MKGFFSLSATVTAGHILQGTIKAELIPSTSETTSKSLKWIGICLSPSFHCFPEFNRGAEQQHQGACPQGISGYRCLLKPL
jgi:hypothetical protein